MFDIVVKVADTFAAVCSVRTSRTATNPFFKSRSNNHSSSSLQVDPFVAGEMPWYQLHSDTLIKYLNFLLRRSPEFAEMLSATEKIEALVRVFFSQHPRASIPPSRVFFLPSLGKVMNLFFS
jgi:hypothetical protein